MIRNDVYWKGSPIQVVPPDPERLKYSEEFLVVHIVVQFSIVEGMGVEGNWVDFSGI